MAITYLKKRVKSSGGPVSDSVFPPTLYKVLYEAVLELKALRVAYLAHTHGCDGSQGSDYTSSTPGLDTKTSGVNAPTTASTVTQRVDVE